MSNKTVSFISLCISAVFTVYFAVLQTVSFSLFSFSWIWFFLAVLFFLLWKKTAKKPAEQKYMLLPPRPRWLRPAAAAAAAVLFLTAAVNLYFILTPDISTGTESAEYIIVLGGGIRQNGTLPPAPLARIKKAAEYMQTHQHVKAVVTGGKLKFRLYAEAPALAAALEAQGIPPARILQEDKAYDTIQNFSYSAAVIAADKGISVRAVLAQPVIVVTSSFHLARAERIARREGYKAVYGIPCSTPALLAADAYCREICAYIKLNLRILLTGKPSALEP